MAASLRVGCSLRLRLALRARAQAIYNKGLKKCDTEGRTLRDQVV